jgi:hypothetical protein
MGALGGRVSGTRRSNLESGRSENIYKALAMMHYLQYGLLQGKPASSAPMQEQHVCIDMQGMYSFDICHSKLSPDSAGFRHRSVPVDPWCRKPHTHNDRAEREQSACLAAPS